MGCGLAGMQVVREEMVEALTRGVASHHAGLLPAWKTLTEGLFQRGLIKIVFATETLAAGINMPARTVVLSSLSKRGDDGHALLTTNSMLQVPLACVQGLGVGGGGTRHLHTRTHT